MLYVLLMIGIKLISIYCSQTDQRKITESLCDKLQCENDSPCRTTVPQKPNQSDERAECLCQGRWTGPRCELEIVLVASDIRQDSVRLEIKTRNVQNVTSASSVHTPNHKYTVKYWSNTTENACLLVQEVTSYVQIIDGLTSDAPYTFCSESGIVDFCEIKLFGLDLPSNCVRITTLNSSVNLSEPEFIQFGVTLIIVFVILIILVVTGIILIRKYYRLQFVFIRAFCSCQTCVKNNKSNRRSSQIHSRYMLTSETPIYTPSEKKELSPSKVNPRLAKRTKMYGAGPEIKHTLSTLIEEDSVVMTETSLTEPLSQEDAQ